MFEPEELMARIVDLEEQLKVSEMAPPAAEQLIACLEGEIAKRDARIVELALEVALRDQALDRRAEYGKQLRAELSALKSQEPVAYIPVDRETGEEWHPVLKKGSGNICDYKPLYAAPVSEARRSAAELFSDVLMCQRNQVETLTGDPYMVGLHNGMSMMIANFDNAPDFECLSVSEAKAQGVVMPERQDDQYGDQDAIGWNACIDEVARLNAAPVSSGDPEKCSYQDDPRSHAELSLAGCNCVRFGECNPHWPCKLHTPAADAWIQVSERLPNIAQEVIVHSEFDGVCAGVLDSYGEWFAPCSEYKLIRVTSWMPMPTKIEANRHD